MTQQHKQAQLKNLYREEEVKYEKEKNTQSNGKLVSKWVSACFYRRRQQLLVGCMQHDYPQRQVASTCAALKSKCLQDMGWSTCNSARTVLSGGKARRQTGKLEHSYG